MTTDNQRWDEAGVEKRIRDYIVNNLLVGEELGRTASLLHNSVLDSTGFLELIMFLETQFGIRQAGQDTQNAPRGPTIPLGAVC